MTNFLQTSPQRRNVTPAKERHPSEGTSPQRRVTHKPQRRNVTPAKERHPSEGTSPQRAGPPKKVTPANERHPSVSASTPIKMDSSIRWNDELLPPTKQRHPNETTSLQRRNVTPAYAGVHSNKNGFQHSLE